MKTQTNLTVAHGELHKIDGKSMTELVGRPFTKQVLTPPHFDVAKVDPPNDNRLKQILLSKAKPIPEPAKNEFKESKLSRLQIIKNALKF